MSIERTLFAAADKMRGAMDPGEYKHVALGLLFLRYVSAAFEAERAEFADDDLADPEDPDEYAAQNVFWVPERARWSRLAAAAKAADIGVQVDDAMREIERSNPSLQDALPKVYGQRGTAHHCHGVGQHRPLQRLGRLVAEGERPHQDAGRHPTHPEETRLPAGPAGRRHQEGGAAGKGARPTGFRGVAMAADGMANGKKPTKE